LCAKAADPELAALVGHRRGRGSGGVLQRLPAEQTSDEEQRDHRQTAAQVRQDEVGQQGYGTPAGLAQVAAHADDAIEGRVDECADVEAVRGERVFDLALRTVVGTIREWPIR
jgi:creatinine amidohydrolase/Fe(II)-dependent formamide hydrolase-like protein